MVLGVVVVYVVAPHAGSADDEERGQQDDLPLLEAQALPFVIDQVEAVRDRDHDCQEQDQQHGFQGEQGQILDDPGQLKYSIGLTQDHLVVHPHDGCVHDDIDEKVDAEPGEDHPGGGDPGPVEEQGEDQGPGDLDEDKGEEVGPRGEQQAAQGVGDSGGHDSHHGAKDHGAEGVDEEGDVDLQVGGDGDAQAFQGHPQGDHQRREHQHPGVPQLGGGVLPVVLGEGGGIQRGGLIHAVHRA